MSENKINDPVLDFPPLFYILDKCQGTVLAAKRQDKYEVSGLYLIYDSATKQWDICPASFNSQLPWEFPTRFIITGDKEEALLFGLMMSTTQPLPSDWCLEKYPRSEDFPKY